MPRVVDNLCEYLASGFNEVTLYDALPVWLCLVLIGWALTRCTTR